MIAFKYLLWKRCKLFCLKTSSIIVNIYKLYPLLLTLLFYLENLNNKNRDYGSFSTHVMYKCHTEKNLIHCIYSFHFKHR